MFKCEKQIELLKYNIADHEKTIIKYREFTRQLQVSVSFLITLHHYVSSQEFLFEKNKNNFLDYARKKLFRKIKFYSI